jgi:hypothetical protein
MADGHGRCPYDGALWSWTALGGELDVSKLNHRLGATLALVYVYCAAFEVVV